MEDASLSQIMPRKHRQYRVDYELLRHPARHMVSENFSP
jgi:hypothetical protein